MLIRLKSLSLVLVAIGSVPLPICNRFHERLANKGKNNNFYGGDSLGTGTAIGFHMSREH